MGGGRDGNFIDTGALVRGVCIDIESLHGRLPVIGHHILAANIQNDRDINYIALTRLGVQL